MLLEYEKLVATDVVVVDSDVVVDDVVVVVLYVVIVVCSVTPRKLDAKSSVLAGAQGFVVVGLVGAPEQAMMLIR